MSTILLDFESRSRADLKTIGGRLYWEHPSTEVICVVLHEVESGLRVTWLPGDPCPFGPEDVLVAHNAMGFDQFAAAALGWRALDAHEPKKCPDCGGKSNVYVPGAGPDPVPCETCGSTGVVCSPPWVDTSEIARVAGLPGSLDALATRWLDMAKDKTGSAVTVSLSRTTVAKEVPAELRVPMRAYHKALKEALAAGGEWPEIPPEILQTVVQYCHSDVDVLVHGWPLLEPWLAVEPDVSAAERAINDRGICFDSALAARLLEEDERNAQESCEAVARAMPGHGPNGPWTAEDVRAAAMSPKLFTAYTGAPNAQAATVSELDHPLARAREALASIARGKLRAGLARVSADGRLRDSCRYFGAHTGRWSGRGMQLQNMPRPADRFDKWGDAEVQALAAAVLAGQHATQDEIDLLLRACLRAAPGHVLVWEDFSGVEARWLAWSADDHAALAVFADPKRSPYKEMAAVIFGQPAETIEKGTQAYTIGKAAELACLAGDTLVLTDRGWHAITEIRHDDRLWDGESWVSHGGLVRRGMRETVDLAGLHVTADHMVWCGTWTPAQRLVSDENIRSHALAIASECLPSEASRWENVGELARSLSRATVDENSARTFATFARGDLDGAPLVADVKVSPPVRRGSGTPRSFRTMGTGVDSSTGWPRSSSVAITRGARAFITTVVAAFAWLLNGLRTASRFFNTFSRYPDGMIQLWTWTGATTNGAMHPATSVSSHHESTRETSARSGYSRRASSNLRRVYDIANAGPLNRFTVWTDSGPLIVHNCGYQMGPAKFTITAEGAGMTWDAPCREDRPCGSATCGRERTDRKGHRYTDGAHAVVHAWRKLHAPSVALWEALSQAFAAACRGEATRVSCYEFCPTDDGSIAVVLPSGRPVMYHEPRISWDADEEREVFSYRGAQFREHLYGGKICENLTQAGCRDLLAAAMVRAAKRPGWSVLSVHDELVREVPIATVEKSIADLHSDMILLPSWAEGFPIGAAGASGERYRK